MSDILLAKEKENEEEVEKGYYRSSLKQIVQFMNTTLPALPDSEEEDQPVQKEVAEKKARPQRAMLPEKKKDFRDTQRNRSKTSRVYEPRSNKEKTQALLLRAGGGKKASDFAPTRTKKELKKEVSVAKKKRVNKYSELKYNDKKSKMKERRKGKK